MSTVLDKLGWIPQSKGSSTSHQIHTKSVSPLVRVSYQGIILCPYWSVLPSFLVNKIGGPHGLLDHVLLGKLNYGPMMCRCFELCLQSPYDENGITSQECRMDSLRCIDSWFGKDSFLSCWKRPTQLEGKESLGFMFGGAAGEGWWARYQGVEHKKPFCFSCLKEGVD